jgi:glycogen debranching enzyme
MTLTDHQRLGDLKAAVQDLYRRNRQQGHAAWCDRDYDFVCPSVERYPFQWFWDSCFHAVVLSRLDPERAATELRTLLANQHPDGFLSHVTFWQRERHESAVADYMIRWRSPWLSDSMQPPILAEATAAVARRGGGLGFLREVLPAVRAFYDWCHRVRDPDGDGLIVVLEPHETGMDQSPSFDAYLGIETATPEAFAAAWRSVALKHVEVDRRSERVHAADRFMVADVFVNTLYAENQRVLADLYAQVGDTLSADELRSRADRTAAAVLTRCWVAEDSDFHALADETQVPLPGGTVAGLLPVLLAATSSHVVDGIAARLRDRDEFGAPFPVPSVARTHPAFRAGPTRDLLWRGPTWINTNWYVARGLRRHGHAGLAARIEDASVALVERSGFREYFNPDTGVGYGARGFAWSALAFEMLVSRVEGDRIS